MLSLNNKHSITSIIWTVVSQKTLYVGTCLHTWIFGFLHPKHLSHSPQIHPFLPESLHLEPSVENNF